MPVGGRVVHSYGRLIPREFPITDLQQISGPDGIGRITCTVSSGTAEFTINGIPQTGGVIETRDGTTTTLAVDPTGTFENREAFCNNEENYFYLFISGNSEFTEMLAGKSSLAEWYCMYSTAWTVVHLRSFAYRDKI